MGFMSRFAFALVILGTIGLTVVNIFAIITIYSQGDTMLHSTGSAVDLNTAMGYILYILALSLVNSIILSFSVFLLNYKLFALEKQSQESYEEEEEDET